MKVTGIIGKKVGMTSLFEENGNNTACTVIEAGPISVTQHKTEETDGYQAVQVGYGSKKEKRTSKALKGHFEKAGVEPKELVREFDYYDKEVKEGDELTVEDLFEVGDLVDIVGTTKGKGFQGGVKRYNFHGVNDATHGQHDRQRAPGAIGGASDPGRVFPGQRMAGRTGGNRVTMQNLRVLKVDAENNLLVVTGSVPGAKNSHLLIQK